MNLNKPIEQPSSKKEFDDNSLMTYEDVLKDLDAGNAVIYEDINNSNDQSQQPATINYNEQIQQEPKQQQMQQGFNDEQMQQQIQYQMQQQFDDEQQYPSEYKRTKDINKHNNKTIQQLDIHDLLFVVISYVLLNNKSTLLQLSKMFPSLYIENDPNIFGVLFQSLILVFTWIVFKKISNMYMLI